MARSGQGVGVSLSARLVGWNTELKLFTGSCKFMKSGFALRNREED
jgi:hypothetical protein